MKRRKTHIQIPPEYSVLTISEETQKMIDAFTPDDSFEDEYYDDEIYPVDDDDEYDDKDIFIKDRLMKNPFIHPMPKKIKFSPEIVEKLTFGSLKELLDTADGSEAYLAAYSDAEFLSYRYNKVNKCYPDLIRFQNIKTKKFIKDLLHYADPPKESYVKSVEDSRGTYRLNSFIIGFNVNGKNDLIVSMDEDEAMIFYNKEYENDPTSVLHTVIGLLRENTEPKVSKNKIFVVYQTQHGFEKMGFSVKKVDVNLKENYNDGFEDIAKEIIDGLNDKKKTNLVILDGDPGTGKTTFIRYLTSKIKKNIIFLSPDMADSITNPSFIPFLIKNNNVVLIIEDAEAALQSRDSSGRTSAVSNVLNLTDGLLSDCLNISIVATFNKGIKTIDEALLRKGRLLKNYKFNKLCVEKSKALLDKLGHSEVEVKQPMSLADIYFYGQENNTKELTHKKIGF